MSSSAALREASRLLAATLRAALLADATLGPLFTGGGHVVSTRTPKEMRTGSPSERGLSVWLYHIDRHGTLANSPPERVGPNELRRPALPVTLHYLLTALSSDSENEQLILGKVLQVFNDRRVLPPDPARPDLDDTLRVHLEPLDLEGITRVWTALDSSFELCVSYVVEPVHVGSGEEPYAVAPVVERSADVTQIVEVM
jgi:Pvc16 N-terminal domain